MTFVGSSNDELKIRLLFSFAHCKKFFAVISSSVSGICYLEFRDFGTRGFVVVKLDVSNSSYFVSVAWSLRSIVICPFL